MQSKKPLLLMILDGWGLREEKSCNAVKEGNTPNMDRLSAAYPFTRLSASGEDVGLPDGQMGNSEVGHLNIGSGRIVYQDLTRISKAIKDKSFFANPVLLNCMQKVRERGASLHLMGLFSDGGVHSHLEHMFSLVELAKQQGVDRVYIHAFLDGRDVPPQSALGFVEQAEAQLKKIGLGEISTVSGRYYAMDRDNRWERVEKAYHNIVYRDQSVAPGAAPGIAASYAAGVNDEFVAPFCVSASTDKGLTQEDGVIFFNFRPDRARELTRALAVGDFHGFARVGDKVIDNYVCMTEYDETFNLPMAFSPERLDDTLGKVLAAHGLKQLRIAETEKYAHVTFFFNGGEEVSNENEDRVLIPSPKVATYDLKPEMSAFEVTDTLLELLDKDIYDVVIMNYANADMVGHSGIMAAAVGAVEAVDKCVGRVAETVLKKGGSLIITADHGNAEQMWDKEANVPYTAHTCNKVPCILVDDVRKDRRLREGGRLADLAPTMLALLKIEKPAAMTGSSLLE